LTVVLFYDCNLKKYQPYLISEAIIGKPLNECWNENELDNDKSLNLNELDKEQTILIIICSMLLNFEDAKEDNFILSNQNKQLIPIDTDHSLILTSTDEKNGIIWGRKIEILLKNLLFCLNVMKEPIHENVIEFIENLNVFEFIKNWIDELKLFDQEFQELSDYCTDSNYLSKFQFMFDNEFIKQLYFKMESMKQFIQLNKCYSIGHLKNQLFISYIIKNLYCVFQLFENLIKYGSLIIHWKRNYENKHKFIIRIDFFKKKFCL
jgi:hypothetical protein